MNRDDMSPAPRRGEGWTCDCGTYNESDRTSCIGCKKPKPKPKDAIAPFQFPATGQQVRTMQIDGEPWFVAVDAATILGYANTRKAIIDHVPAGHQKGNESFPLADLGLHPQTKLISEAGLYRLIMRSNTALAEPFQEWVTAEVLPAIRKTGSYSTAPALGDPLAELERQTNLTAQAIQIAKTERARADAAEERAAELEGPAHSWDVLASGQGDYSVADAAKILTRDPAISIGERRLFTELHDAGWIYRQRGDNRWRAYQAQIDNGRLSELPQQYENPDTGELALAAPQVRVKVKGLRELHRQLGGIAQLHFGEQLAIGGGAR